jgi:MFS transporter, DHA2 family, multidrug resistance protein
MTPVADPTTAATAAPALATRREWIGLAVIALPCLVYAMDLTVLNLALPALSTELKPSSSQLLWIVDVYGFLVAGFLITMGTLGDRIGRRKLLLIGAAAFMVASAIAAFSRSAETLIAMRALVGIAGATLAPSTITTSASASSRSASGSRPSRSAAPSARWWAACCSSTSGGARSSCRPFR